MKEKNHFKTATIILSLILLIIIGFLAFLSYKSYMQNSLQNAYAEGYSQAVNDAVIKIIQDTDNCGVTTIYAGNLTRQVADVACIQKVIEQSTG